MPLYPGHGCADWAGRAKQSFPGFYLSSSKGKIFRPAKQKQIKSTAAVFEVETQELQSSSLTALGSHPTPQIFPGQLRELLSSAGKPIVEEAWQPAG